MLCFLSPFQLSNRKILLGGTGSMVCQNVVAPESAFPCSVECVDWLFRF